MKNSNKSQNNQVPKNKITILNKRYPKDTPVMYKKKGRDNVVYAISEGKTKNANGKNAIIFKTNKEVYKRKIEKLRNQGKRANIKVPNNLKIIETSPRLAMLTNRPKKLNK